MGGFKKDRFDSNLKEKEFHDKFIENNKEKDDMNFIVFGQKSVSGFHPNDCLTDREKSIVISTIQWLGSSVGQGF
jgi:hypothetical protein